MDPDGRNFWDIVQGGLDVVGVIPGIGEVADLANAGISLARGDYLGASLSLISVIPIVGDAIGKTGKVANAALKYSDEIAGAVTDVAKKVHGNSKLSTKAQHGYEIFNKETDEILEYGISGQTRSAKQIAEGGSPRINQKLSSKYGNDPNVGGRVTESNLGNRQQALDWEQGKVNDFKNTKGYAPPSQQRPTPNE